MRSWSVSATSFSSSGITTHDDPYLVASQCLGALRRLLPAMRTSSSSRGLRSVGTPPWATGGSPTHPSVAPAAQCDLSSVRPPRSGRSDRERPQFRGSDRGSGYGERTDVESKTVHGYGPRCHTCDLGIEMRYSLTAPKSKSQGYWSHQDTTAGIAADLDHDALR
jgi:hypothetical protein